MTSVRLSLLATALFTTACLGSSVGPTNDAATDASARDALTADDSPARDATSPPAADSSCTWATAAQREAVPADNEARNLNSMIAVPGGALVTWMGSPLMGTEPTVAWRVVRLDASGSPVGAVQTVAQVVVEAGSVSPRPATLVRFGRRIAAVLWDPRGGCRVWPLGDDGAVQGAPTVIGPGYCWDAIGGADSLSVLTSERPSDGVPNPYNGIAVTVLRADGTVAGPPRAVVPPGRRAYFAQRVALGDGTALMFRTIEESFDRHVIEAEHLGSDGISLAPSATVATSSRRLYAVTGAVTPAGVLAVFSRVDADSNVPQLMAAVLDADGGARVAPWAMPDLNSGEPQERGPALIAVGGGAMMLWSDLSRGADAALVARRLDAEGRATAPFFWLVRGRASYAVGAAVGEEVLAAFGGAAVEVARLRCGM